MSVVLLLAGKKYTISSASVEKQLLEKAAQLFEAAAQEINQKEPALSEGQLCAMVTMRCLVPLLKEQQEFKNGVIACVEELSQALSGG